MQATGTTPKLNAALAAFQAEVPKIVKDEVGVIPGKDGKQGYKYRYADLATVSAAALPVLGKHGLAFFAKPGILGTQFGMICKLKHSSGEEEEGFYPLPGSGSAQQIGSAITYARRYSMLMMTGLAPAEDDDDSAAANTTQRYAPQSASEAFERATPAPPRTQPAANGNTVRPAQAPRPPAAADGELDEDAQSIADEASQVRTTEDLKTLNTKALKEHKLAALIRNPTTGGTGGLGQYIAWRKSVLQKAERALADLKVAAVTAGIDDAEMEHRLIAASGHNLEEATAEDMVKAAELIIEGAGAAA
jgi:hypothetical protein